MIKFSCYKCENVRVYYENFPTPKFWSPKWVFTQISTLHKLSEITILVMKIMKIIFFFFYITYIDTIYLGCVSVWEKEENTYKSIMKERKTSVFQGSHPDTLLNKILLTYSLLLVPVRVPSLGQIDLFENYYY